MLVSYHHTIRDVGIGLRVRLHHSSSRQCPTAVACAKQEEIFCMGGPEDKRLYICEQHSLPEHMWPSDWLLSASPVPAWEVKASILLPASRCAWRAEAVRQLSDASKSDAAVGVPCPVLGLCVLSTAAP